MIAACAAIGLALALACQFAPHDPPSWRRSALKTGATAALALVAVLAPAPGFLVVALALGALGDFFLSRPGQGAFLAGLVAFAAAHLAYIGLFLGLPGSRAPLDLAGPGWAGMALLLVLALSTLRWLLPHTGALRGAVAGYVAVICAMGAVALHLDPGFWVAGLGVAMFLASDLVLAVRMFRLPKGSPAHSRAQQWVWPLYWGGQALIAYGIVQGTVV